VLKLVRLRKVWASAGRGFRHFDRHRNKRLRPVDGTGKNRFGVKNQAGPGGLPQAVG
jgi:hypothetical protein